MGFSKSFGFRVLRLIRCVLDFTTALVLGLLYGKWKCVPPVTDDTLLLSATELAEKIRKKQLKSEYVVAAYIARIREVQPLINAVVEDRFDEALAEARIIDEMVASGEKSDDDLRKLFPFLGVPFSIKEHVSVKNMRSTNGLIVLKDNVPENDSDVVKLLRRAGAIPLVTTNVPESLLGWESSSKLYGATSNPYDLRRTAGGSSGGEGALIGAAGSVIGIGTDLGGSIRLPAVMNGIFGHKTSSGIIPSGGVNTNLAIEVLKYSAIGPLCRYGGDLLPMLKIMTKNDPILRLNDPVDLKKLNIYYAEDIGNCPLASPVVPAVQRSLKMALDHFRNTYGIEPVEVEFRDLGESGELWNHMMTEAHPEPFAELLSGGKGKTNVLFEFIKWIFRLSNYNFLSLFNTIMIAIVAKKGRKDHKAALGRFARLKCQFDDILKDNNSVFLYPTQPEPAPFHCETITKIWNVGYTSIFNVLEYPVTHAPITMTEEGLPVGLQCVSNTYNDRVSIAVAVELGRVFGGWIPPSN